MRAMSADNWTICPRCCEAAEKVKAAKEKKAADAYGKKPMGAYLALQEEAEKPIAIQQTFREDYEVGIDRDGGNGFHVRYSGGCRACKLSFEYKYEEDVPL